MKDVIAIQSHSELRMSEALYDYLKRVANIETFFFIFFFFFFLCFKYVHFMMIWNTFLLEKFVT